ncbi:MAG: hypothetical protein WCP85_28845 [Mariniphaga sp.]
MKQLVIKILAFTTLIILLDFAAGYLFRYLETKALNNNPHGMIAEFTMWKAEGDIMIFGSSEVRCGLVPSLMKNKLGLSVYNCGNLKQPFLYQYCMINSILERKKPKVILWSIYSCYLNTPTEGDMNGMSVLNPFYDTNDYCKRVINKKSNYENLKMESNLYRYNSRIFYLLNNIISNTETDMGYVARYNTRYKYTTLFSGSEECGIDSEIADSFIEVIKKCKASNVELILINTPKFENIDNSKNLCFKNLIEICAKYDVPLIGEFYNSPIFLSDSTLFWDYFHLNDKGARLFTTLLCDRIKQIIETENSH